MPVNPFLDRSKAQQRSVDAHSRGLQELAKGVSRVGGAVDSMGSAVGSELNKGYQAVTRPPAVNPFMQRSEAQQRAVGAHARGLQELAKGVSQAGAAVGSVGPAVGAGLNQNYPEYQGMPTRTPSQVASQVIPSAQEVGAGIGSNIAEGLNKVDPQYQGLPIQTPSQVAGRVTGMLPGPAPIPARPGLSAGAALQSLFDGTTASRASGGAAPFVPSGPPRPARFGSGMQVPSSGPNPVSLQTRPDFPQLNTQASMGGGMQLPRGPLAPFDGYTPPVPYNGASSADQDLFAAQGALPTPVATPPNVFAAPSGQRMVGQAPPAPMMGPAPPAPGQNPVRDRAEEGIKSLLASGALGAGRLGVQDPGMNQPLAADLQAPQRAGVSGAADFYRNNGRLMTNEEAGANYRSADPGLKYFPNTTRGGAAVPTQREFAERGQRSDERIAKQASIARQGNFRESMLADRNLRGLENVPISKPQHDFGIRSSGNFETDASGRTTKKGGYSTQELQAQAAAKAKLNSPERQEYLANRKAELDYRKQGVQARAAEKSAARSDTVRLRKGRATFEERLAMADPRSDAARAVGKANVDAAASRDRATDQYRRDVLEQRVREGEERNRTAQKVSQDRVNIARIEQGLPPVAEGGEGAAPAAPSRPRTDADLRLLPPTERVPELVKRHGEARANEIMNEQNGTKGHNYIQNPEGPGAFQSFADWLFGQGGNGVPPGMPSSGMARMGGGMQLPPAGQGAPIPPRPATPKPNKPRGSLVSSLREPK